MLEGTLSVYAFILIFPLAVIGGLIFLIRNFIRTTEYCDADARFDGKTIVITGGSNGLGRSLCAELVRRGARVIVACRTRARSDSTAFFLRNKTGSLNLRTVFVDLTRLDSVWDFCREIVDSEEKIDAIVNNAAILTSSADHTPDDLDSMLGVNYVSHYLLARLLQSKQPESKTLRVINVVCGGMRAGSVPTMDQLEGKETSHYDARGAYRSSKLALHMFTKELAQRYKDKGVVAFSADPGYVNTTLYKNLEGAWGKLNQICASALYRTTEEGIQTILHCLASREAEKESGSLFRDCVPRQEPKGATEKSIAELWERTESLILSKNIKVELVDEEEEEEEEKEETED